VKVLDLFSGIGGFSLGLERAGMETIAFCEIEKFPREVLAKHWPNIPIYEDVRNVTKKRLDADGIRPDVVCGGFPCQDLSVAGNQKGIHAERSGLWGELCRIIGEVRPKYAIVENVTALISGDSGRWFGRVLGDLAEIGYDCEWHCISASELGAHHHRDRVWIICYPQHTRRDATEIRESNQAGNGSDQEGQKSTSESQGPGNAEVLANPISSRQPGPRLSFNPSNQAACRKGQAGNVEYVCLGGKWPPEPAVCRMVNGVRDGIYPGRVIPSNATPKGETAMRQHRLKGLGNAVVPQIPELIGRAIMEAENEESR